MEPFGKTLKKVATSLFTVSVSVSYNGTHWVTMPPGFRCCFTSSKYSLEYRVALPLTQGWMGSEVMMSNFSLVVRTKWRASSYTIWTRGLCITLEFALAKDSVAGGGMSGSI